MNNQSKVQVYPAPDSAGPGASQEARRATEDAPEAARRVSPSTDSEVTAPYTDSYVSIKALSRAVACSKALSANGQPWHLGTH